MFEYSHVYAKVSEVNLKYEHKSRQAYPRTVGTDRVMTGAKPNHINVHVNIPWTGLHHVFASVWLLYLLADLISGTPGYCILSVQFGVRQRHNVQYQLHLSLGAPNLYCKIPRL